MSEVRLKAWLEAMRGDVVANGVVRNVNKNLFPLTSDNPNFNLTFDQKAAIVLTYMRAQTRALVGAGAEAAETANQATASIEAIRAARAAAMGEV